MFLSILASDANFNVHESKIGTQKNPCAREKRSEKKRKIGMIEVCFY